MRILVTDGSQRAALAVVRSLGRRHDEVIVGEAFSGSLAAASKYCSSEFVYPSPLDRPLGFLSTIDDWRVAKRVDLIIPITDITATLISQLGASSERTPGPPHRTIVALPSAESLEIAHDKVATIRTAQSLGVPVPETAIVDDLGELPQLAASLKFPVVIKSRRSRSLRDGKWSFGSVRYVDAPRKFVELYHREHQKSPFPIVQERIEGNGAGVFLLCDQGEPIVVFSHRRIREKPPSGGVSVVSESVAPDPAMVDYATRLMRATKWHGVAMVEFKIDSKDNKPKLMEINGRFWGTLQLAISSGVDFPALLVDLLGGKKIAVANEYRTGVRCRWFLGDLDHLLTILLHRRRNLGLPRSHPGRLRSLYNFLVEPFRGSFNEVWRRDDPRPGFVEVREYIRDILKSIRRRLGR